MKEIIGSIYTGVSDNFQRGLFPIFRCVKAENHDLGVVEMEVKVIGQMDNTIDHTFESANRVYDVGGYLLQSILAEVVVCNRRF